MQVRSLGWEDSLEEGMATSSSTGAWRIPMDRVAWWATVHGSQRVGHNSSDLACSMTYFVQSNKDALIIKEKKLH